MIERIKGWFQESRAADTDYTAQMIGRELCGGSRARWCTGKRPFS